MLQRKSFVLWIFAFLCLYQPLTAQTETDEGALLEVENGVSFSQNSLFLLNLRFRMQNRFGFTTKAGNTIDVNQFEARVRRLRLRFDGYVLNPKFSYYIQLSFSKADQDLELGTVPQTIRDAMFYYHISQNFYVGLGQSKLPGNRQRVISSGNLQFTDRSLANAIYTLDRDFGFFAYYTLPFSDGPVFNIKGAITTGDGRNASPVNEGLAYTGRVEVLPFGEFINSGDYSEGDLEFETTPKLSLGLSMSVNKKASRTGGQLGRELYGFRDIHALIADMMFKYQGWMLSSEYLQRNVNNPFTQNAEGDIRYIITGWGWNTQLSRMISPKAELAFRYTAVNPNDKMEGYERHIEESTLGSTYYLNRHRIKIQGNITYRWYDTNTELSHENNRWGAMFQIEFGI
ncbi:porin [Catalinimonas niigatensis]|uniref:porin n=1 Tax=Catalinimonas niigatensis TaxID=1397264 RepID=UPI0026667816|nr:porin [Catalinimonas niigatensis]WPP49467.1 porin [Catalinimonas niigatensis]